MTDRIGDEHQAAGYCSRPSVFLIADSDAGLERARNAAMLNGSRVAGDAQMPGGLERLDRQVMMDGVFADIQHDHGSELDCLLDRLNDAAEAGRYGSVVSAPPALLDIVAARVTHGKVRQLCEAHEAERVAALAEVSVRPRQRLRDVGSEGGTPGLRQISEEVGRIAQLLATLSEQQRGPQSQARKEKNGRPEADLDAGFVRAVIRARRLRDQYFSSELFADPAWDMLLDLMAARIEKRRVAVSSLCIAAAVPATTALRWIKTLTDLGLFVRAADPQDGRRVYIELSDDAANALAGYLTAAQRISPLIV